jgi:hypothetical protein
LTQNYLRGKKAALAAGPKTLPPRLAREEAKAAIKAMAPKKKAPKKKAPKKKAPKKKNKPAEDLAKDKSAPEDQAPPQA